MLNLNLEWLLKLRLAVARCGEMDCARWWNTDGQLGPSGATFLRRGFPRTHYFAQARSVFAAASARCAEVFPLQGVLTLWWLGEDIEDAFDLQWEAWLDSALDWKSHYDALAQSRSADLTERLGVENLVSPEQMASLAAFELDPSGRTLCVSEAFVGDEQTVALLALGFAKGETGRLVVPYARLAG